MKCSIKVAFLSTYPPRECGLATFTQNLVLELNKTGWVNASVVAVSDGIYRYGSEVLFDIRQQKREDYVSAAERISKSGADMLMVEHEYGIFGGQWGEYVLDLIGRLELPFAVTLHTVLSSPDDLQRRIVRILCEKSEAVVVMARHSAVLLSEVYGIVPRKITVIPHGVPRIATPSREQLKYEMGFGERPVVSTFGLISPGKGLEYAICAIGKVAKVHSDVLYLILGQTHPVVKRQFGEQYRESLENLVRELGLENNVRFVNRYLSKEEIIRYLKVSDIYVTPYLGREQAVSGTLAYAVGCGRVIVSTPYVYAQEMLAEGRGLLAEFKDADSLARHISFLIENPEERAKMEERARCYGEQMMWDKVAQAYANVFRDIAISQIKVEEGPICHERNKVHSR